MSHDLFPLPPNLPDDFTEDTREIVRIDVERRDESNKEWVSAPRSHAAAELPDRAALHALYGGGCYRLIGRNAQGRITARNEPLRLPGAPLPLDGSGPAPAAAAGALAGLAGGGGQGAWGALVAILPALLTLCVTWIQSQGEARRAAEERMTQLLVLTMGGAREDAKMLVQAMAQIHGGGGGGAMKPDTLLETLKLGFSLASQSAQAQSGDGAVLAIGQALGQGAGALAELSKAKQMQLEREIQQLRTKAPPAPPSPPSPPAPPAAPAAPPSTSGASDARPSQA